MLNALLNNETNKIITALGEENVRFVGGCVRDVISGITPTDIDFATTLTPDQVIECLDYAGIRNIPTGIEYGTISAIYNQNIYQITSLRQDIETNGRHARVQYTDEWETDAQRRDFTINGMYLDSRGKLYDYFGGMDHLRNGRVVFIGEPEKRIKEDYLRILRYFRFVGKFGKGDPEDMTARICARYSGHLQKLSGERIQAEMKKIIMMPNTVEVLENMQTYGILLIVFSTDVDYSLLGNLCLVEHAPSFLRRLAAIKNYDIGFLAERWKLSGSDQKILKLLLQEADFSNPKIALRRLGPDRFVDQVLLAAAKGTLLYNVDEMIEFAHNWQIPKFPIVGKDALELGLKEGKTIGQLLQRLEHYWEVNNFHFSREDLLKRLKHEVDELLKKEGKLDKKESTSPLQKTDNKIENKTEPKVITSGKAAVITQPAPKPIADAPKAFGNKKPEDIKPAAKTPPAAITKKHPQEQ